MARWPVDLHGVTPAGEEVVLDPLRRRDREEWRAVRAANASWLAEWEASAPDGEPLRLRFGSLVRHYNAEARAGRMLPFVVRAHGAIVGQMHLFGLAYGSLRSAAAGYWVTESVAGRGIAPTALALAGDYLLGDLGMHRLEVNIRPDNAASLVVARKLGFRDEGIRRRYLHINGAWRDHRTFALTAEELTGTSLYEYLHSNHTSHTGDTPGEVRGERQQPA